jgi:FkbM family methyltransferase
MFQTARQVKNALGKFKVIKDLILYKLDKLLLKFDDLNSTANVLLESSSYQIEAEQAARPLLSQVAATQEAAQPLLEDLAATARTLLETSAYLTEQHQMTQQQLQAIVPVCRDSAVQLAAVRQETQQQLQTTMLALQAIEAKLQALPLPPHVVPVPSQSDQRTWGNANPESDLLAYLYSFLPGRTAIDIGANRGEMTAVLLDAGFEVIAFEPYALIYEQLQARFRDHPQFTSHCLAIGQTDGVLPLHIAQDLSDGRLPEHPSVYNSLQLHPLTPDLAFGESVEVTVRSLASLHQSQIIPATVAVVKIDTEGFDLAILQGMGPQKYAVVMTEFWDSAMAFGGQTYTIQDLVKEMRGRGYHWHLVIYRDTDESIRFYSNATVSVPQSWGNVLFFQSLDVFNAAREWCRATLTPTYFRVGKL